MEIYEVVGKNIRNLRKSVQPPISINRLATAAEIDPGQLSRAERGLAGLSLPALARIAETLGVPVIRLIDQRAKQVSEPDQVYSYSRKDETRAALISKLAGVALNESLSELDKAKIGKSEEKLLLQQIQAAIEEGVMRGQIKAENELAQLRKNRNL